MIEFLYYTMIYFFYFGMLTMGFIIAFIIKKFFEG